MNAAEMLVLKRVEVAVEDDEGKVNIKVYALKAV